jgi:hypothetical protein
MASLTCQVCGTGAEPGDLICPECGSNLARPAVPREPPDPATVQGATPATLMAPGRGLASETGSPPVDGGEFCPHCGAGISDPANLVCIECLRPLREAAGGARPAGETALRLVFPSWDIEVAAGTSVLLGRDGASPAAAPLARHDNISRRHATVTVTGAGQAIVRDEHSTNGTFVNSKRAAPGQDLPLRDGDTLRLASDVTATVHLPREL